MKRRKSLLFSFFIVFIISCSNKNGEKAKLTETKTEEDFNHSEIHEISKEDSLKYFYSPKVNIKGNQIISSPLEIVVRSNENWKAYDSILGMVSLLNANDFDKQYAESALIAIGDNWMSGGAESYFAILRFDSTKFENGHLFFEYYPSNGKEYKYHKILVRIK